jgi:hypothetical protein
MSDAIYTQMHGSLFDEESGFWVIPCNAEVNVTFTFAGRTIPIHPLDLIRPMFTNGSTSTATLRTADVCFGTVRPDTPILENFAEPYAVYAQQIRYTVH